MTEFFKALGCLQHSAHLFWLRFRIKLIRITDDLLFQRLWLKARKARSCMAFTNTGMSLVALCSEQFATNLSMTDVRLRTITMDGRSVTTEDAQIMQHGSLFQELYVNGQLTMFFNNS